MIYGSVCSGIEAASVAWHPLGWRASFLSEIDAFPRAVLAHHYPKTPLHGDFTTINAGDYEPINLLVGGTPCQSFSVAGLRGGLGDERGNLALEYLRLAKRLRPDWLVWENVPGVLSSNGGRDFGSILGGMVELGYGFAYRVLDAQYFGVPQRRRRVFVVGYLGNWRPAFAVLFERHSLQGHPAPRRATGQGFTAATAPSLTASGRGVERTGESRGQDPVVAVARDDALGAVDTCPTLRAGGNRTGGDRPPGTDVDTCESLIPVACPLDMTSGQANAEIASDRAPTLNCLHEAPILAAQAIAIQANCIGRKDENGPQGLGAQVEVAYTLEAREVQAVACEVADSQTVGANQTTGFVGDCVVQGFAQNQRDEVRLLNVAGALAAEPGMKQQTFVAQTPPIGWSEELTAHVDIAATIQRGGQGGRHDGVMMPTMQVRRLTPRECERLQGFPDDYTLIQVRGKPAADGPRYKALGNSFAVPVVRWLGERIQLVEGILAEQVRAAE